MNIRRLVTLLAFGVLTLVSNCQTTVDLYVFAGQSNGLAGFKGTLVGDTYPADSTRYYAPMSSYIFNPYWDTTYYQTIFSNIPRWKPLLMGENTGGFNADVNYFGAETPMAYWMASPIYILKHNGNGVAITWYTGDKISTGFKNSLIRAFTQAYQQHKNLNLKAFIWNQGENDAVGADLSSAYRVSLDSLFRQFEREYGKLCTKYSMTNRTSTYKKVIVQTRSTGGQPYLSVVETAKKSFVANESNAIYWGTVGYWFRADSLHYKSVNYLKFGIDLANYFNNGTIPLFAPNFCTVTSVDSTLKVGWKDNSSTEDGFKVERSPDGLNNWTVVRTTSANDTTWTDNTVSCGTTYYYRVRAFKGLVYSYYTNSSFEESKSCSDLILTDGNTLGWFISSASSTITKDGGNIVSEWRDSLGAGVALTTTTGNPVWSSSGITLTADRMTAANFGLSTDPVSAYFVIRFDESLAGAFPLNIVGLLVNTHTTPDDIFLHSVQTPAISNSTGVYYVARFKVIGTDGKIGLDATTSAITGVTRVAETLLQIGGRAGAGTFMNITIKEIIIRKVNDSTDDETVLYNYLKTKYGL